MLYSIGICYYIVCRINYSVSVKIDPRPLPVPVQTRTREVRVRVWTGTGTGQDFLPGGYPCYSLGAHGVSGPWPSPPAISCDLSCALSVTSP